MGVAGLGLMGRAGMRDVSVAGAGGSVEALLLGPSLGCLEIGLAG